MSRLAIFGLLGLCGQYVLAAVDSALFTAHVQQCPAMMNVAVIAEETHVQCGELTPKDCCNRLLTFPEVEPDIPCNVMVAEDGCCLCYEDIDEFIPIDREVVAMILPKVRETKPIIDRSYRKHMTEYAKSHTQSDDSLVPQNLLEGGSNAGLLEGPLTSKTPQFKDTNLRCKCSESNPETCTCPEASSLQEQSFYLYSAIRSKTRLRKNWGNKNFGSLAGVLYYIHNEVVVSSCPRHFHITEIARLKVTMLNTPGQPFRDFVTYDFGLCKLEHCLAMYNRTGYTVGCQNSKEISMPYHVYGDNGHQILSPQSWFSLPGPCPQEPYDRKTDACIAQFPGGECNSGEVMGTNNCTWSAELDGYITLNELYNITDDEYDNVWCKQTPGKGAKRGIEYSRATDTGIATSFWNDAKSVAANARRIVHAQNVFAQKYPQSTEVGAPYCTHVRGQTIRFMSWNLFYANLGSKDRYLAIARSIQSSDAQIMSLQELGQERAVLADALGSSFKFASHLGDTGKPDTLWDSDILYRQDLWEERGSGVVPFAESRGISWAALVNKENKLGLLVYGVHPPCCVGDQPVLELVVAVTTHIEHTKKTFPYPVILMGDMNAGYYAASQKLLREGHVDDDWNSQGMQVMRDGTVDKREYGEWNISMTFVDAWAATHRRNPNERTSAKTNKRLDYVYIEQIPHRDFTVVHAANVWDMLGGSDHAAVSADIAMPASTNRAHQLSAEELSSVLATADDFFVLRPTVPETMRLGDATGAGAAATEDDAPADDARGTTATQVVDMLSAAWASVRVKVAAMRTRLRPEAVAEMIASLGYAQRIGSSVSEHDLFVGYMMAVVAVLAACNASLFLSLACGITCTRGLRHDGPAK